MRSQHDLLPFTVLAHSDTIPNEDAVAPSDGPSDKPTNNDKSPGLARVLTRSGGLADLPEAERIKIYQSAREINDQHNEPRPWPKTLPADFFLKLEFPPIRWMVPNIFPEGATLLAGRPKSGKTFLALNIGWAVAAGGMALGKVQVEQGRVLYLVLEGSQRNMQDRMRALARSYSIPEDLELAFSWPRLGEGGLEALQKYLYSYPDTRLVIIDTFKRIRSGASPSRGGTLYDEDYEAIQQFSRMAEESGCGILLIHHTNKMTLADDPLDMISGSTGLVAAVDTGAVLTYAQTGGTALYVRGRDIEQTELALSWDTTLMTWCLEGDAEEYRLSAERQQILDAVRRGYQSPREVTDYTELNHDSVRHLMIRLLDAGKLSRVATGRYAIRKPDLLSSGA